MFDAFLQSESRRFVGRSIAERHSDIPQPAFVADAPDRRTFGAFEKFVLAPREQIDQLRTVEAVARREIGQGGFAGVFIPRADQLAVIAAVNAIAQQWPQLFGNCRAQFDRQVRNAAPRIDTIGADDRLSGADIDATRAGATMRRGRLIQRQRQVGVEFAEKKPRTGVAIEQIAVFADPAEARISRQRFFHDRRRVDKRAITEWPDRRRDAIRELLQTTTQNLVIIAPECVARDIRKLRIFEHFPRITCVRWIVIHAHRDHAQGARLQFVRTTAFAAVPLHVLHFAVMSGLQPRTQVCGIFLQIDAGDADLLESKFHAPAPDLGNQFGRVAVR